MPRELIAPAQNRVAFREIEVPPPGPGEIGVRTLYGSPKHGTEMAQFLGYGAFRGAFDPKYRVWTTASDGVDHPVAFDYPVALGNLCVGEATAIGDGVDRFSPGDVVFRLSRLAEEHVWPVDRRTYHLPDGVSWKAAVCLDPAVFALDAVRDGGVRIGDAVAVFGMGAIGLFAVQFAKLSGARPVIAVEMLPLRQDVARQAGADIVLNPNECDAGLEIKKATGKRGADVCIEFSGAMAAMQHALRGIAYGGTVVAGAWPGEYPAGLDFGAEAHMNRARIVFARSCSEPNNDHPRWDEQRVWDTSWELLSSGRAVSEPIVQPVVAFEDLLEEYPKIATDPGSMVKLGVRF